MKIQILTNDDKIIQTIENVEKYKAISLGEWIKDIIASYRKRKTVVLEAVNDKEGL